jgi:stage V sporulation protein R
MTHDELKRLIKIEDRIHQIAAEMGLKYVPIEWDVVPPPKMLEIMAYRGPTQVSSWKFGRDYERIRTMYDHGMPIPLEVVINDNPARAYLMNSNPLAVNVMVMAHVVGHVAFFTISKWFKSNRRDVSGLLADAYVRFNEYEHVYGYEAVEKTIDAAH